MDQFSRCRRSLASEQITEILNQLKFFDFNGYRIRAVEHEGKRWIVFADVCKAQLTRPNRFLHTKSEE